MTEEIFSTGPVPGQEKRKSGIELSIETQFKLMLDLKKENEQEYQEAIFEIQEMSHGIEYPELKEQVYYNWKKEDFTKLLEMLGENTTEH